MQLHDRWLLLILRSTLPSHIIQKKNKEEAALDAYFWPCLKLETVSQSLDSNRQPTVTQEYSVPPPKDDVYKRHDSATYSMWMHFCDLCASSQGSSKGKRDYRESLDGTLSLNLYSKGQRLEVFRSLSSQEEFGAISPVPTVSYQPIVTTPTVMTPTPMPTVKPASRIQDDRSFLSAVLKPSSIPSTSTSVPLTSTRSSKINLPSSPSLAQIASQSISPRIVAQQSFVSPARSTYIQVQQPSGRNNADAERPSHSSGSRNLPADLSFLHSPVHLAKTRSTSLFFENQADAVPNRFESFGRDSSLLSPAASPRTDLSLHTTSEEVSTVSETFSSATASTDSCSQRHGSSFNPNAQSFVPGSTSSLGSSCFQKSMPYDMYSQLSGAVVPIVEMDVLSDLVEGLSCRVADFEDNSELNHSVKNNWLDTEDRLWDSSTMSSQSASFFPAGWTSGNPMELDCRPCPHTDRELNSLLMDSTLGNSSPSSSICSRLGSPNTVAYDFSCQSSRATSPVHMHSTKHPSTCSVFPTIPSSTDEYAINASIYDPPSLQFHYASDSSLLDFTRDRGDLQSRNEWNEPKFLQPSFQPAWGAVKSDAFQALGNHDLYSSLLDDDERHHPWPCGV